MEKVVQYGRVKIEKREQIIARAWKDPEFKKRLLTKPREALKEMGWNMPENVTIKVVEESNNSYTFVLPPTPIAIADLSEMELIKSAGGSNYFCDVTEKASFACCMVPEKNKSY